MMSIKFDGVYFTTLEALFGYISDTFGSWSEVPEDHPDVCVVDRLCVHNPDHHLDVDGVVYHKYSNH